MKKIGVKVEGSGSACLIYILLFAALDPLVALFVAGLGPNFFPGLLVAWAATALVLAMVTRWRRGGGS